MFQTINNSIIYCIYWWMRSMFFFWCQVSLYKCIHYIRKTVCKRTLKCTLNQTLFLTMFLAFRFMTVIIYLNVSANISTRFIIHIFSNDFFSDSTFFFNLMNPRYSNLWVTLNVHIHVNLTYKITFVYWQTAYLNISVILL